MFEPSLHPDYSHAVLNKGYVSVTQSRIQLQRFEEDADLLEGFVLSVLGLS